MRKKLYPLLVQHGASRRLLNTLWKFDHAFTVGRHITLGQFLRDWPRARLEKELFGFGQTMRLELARVLGAIPLPPPHAFIMAQYQAGLREVNLGPAATAKRLVAAIEELRDGLAESVTLLQTNDNPPPTEAIIVNGEWTGFKDQRFEGDSLLEALTKAVAAKRQSNSHLK